MEVPTASEFSASRENPPLETQLQLARLYKGIVEGSLQGIIIQQDERIVYANAAMAKLFAYDAAEEMLGLSPFEDLILGEDLREFRARTTAVYRDESVAPHAGWLARRRDRQPLWIASTAHKTEWRGRPAVASFYFDITDRKKAELALRENEAIYRAALSAGHMGAWETDLIGRTRLWTPEGMALFGLSLPEGVGRVGGDDDEYVAAMHPDDRHLAAEFHALADQVDGFPAEYRIVRPDGAVLWLSGRGQVVGRTADGRAHRLISIMADISERKANEDRVEFLLRELAHRSSNLMAVVQSIARRIARSATSLEEFSVQFGKRLQALAASHKVLAKQTWAAASLHDLLREQLQPFVRDVDAAADLSGADIFLSVDATQNLGLAIHELATNALKHGAWSAIGGKVAVRWEIEIDEDGSRRLILEWTERGGPPASPPIRKGFGHLVLYELVPQSLKGRADGEYRQEGFRWRASMDGSHLKDRPS